MINNFANDDNLFDVPQKLSRSPILCDRKLDRFGAVQAAGRSGRVLLEGGERAVWRGGGNCRVDSCESLIDCRCANFITPANEGKEISTNLNDILSIVLH